MADVSVTIDGKGYRVDVKFPKVEGQGVNFPSITATAPLIFGSSADAVWIKARAKPLETRITKAMSIDIAQIENYRATLLKQDVMAKTVRDQLRKSRLDQKAAEALAAKLVVEDFTKRWDKFCKVTLPSGVLFQFKELIKTEATALKAQLAKDAEVKKGDYSMRPAVTIGVSALATIGAILGAASLPVAALAAITGLIGQGKIWIGHRKEIAGKLAITRDAEAGIRSGVEAAAKGLEQATKSLETLATNLKLAVAAGALTEMEALAGQGARLGALDAPAAVKAKAALEAAAKTRAAVAQDLKDQAKRLVAMKTALGTAQDAVTQAAKLSGEGAKVWDGTLKKVETMLDNVDDALKGVEGLKSLAGV
ncbi:hypothetical protein NX862_01025 [Rhodobacter sp. KR11]|uniref:hypothetical protein n=1 Tax=Rhodobacter sp. KR11 TaxID=2974588 RepID=UPI002221FE99|nr:hypothetical protein [Rhodobacter sp. KR11]MCW1917328.1 hypothetical protein [Rhodobacter sp. KR11]